MGIEQRPLLWHLPPREALFAQLPLGERNCPLPRWSTYEGQSGLGHWRGLPLSMVKHVSAQSFRRWPSGAVLGWNDVPSVPHGSSNDTRRRRLGEDHRNVHNGMRNTAATDCRRDAGSYFRLLGCGSGAIAISRWSWTLNSSWNEANNRA